MSDRDRALWAALALAALAPAACHRRSPPAALPSPPVGADAGVPAPVVGRAEGLRVDVATDGGHPALLAACEALTQASLARWDALVRAHRDRASVPVMYLPESRARVRQRWSCVPMDAGAWALALEDATLAVVFVRPDGTTSRVTPPGCALDPRTPGFLATALAPRQLDGRTDALVTCDNGRGAWVAVASAGVVAAPLPIAGDDLRLDDVDHDGRIDVTAALGALDGEARGRGVTFVAHAQPDGAFALDDQVARVALRGQCPERPTSLLAPTRPALDTEEWRNTADEVARRVVCARVWNLPVAEIAALVERAQSDGPPAATGEPADADARSADGGVRFPLPRAALLRLASTVRPPLRLRPTPLPTVTATPAAAALARPPSEAGAPTDPGPPTWTGAIARECAAATARVRRLTAAESARAGESATDAGTDTIDGRPVTRRMNVLRRSLGQCVAARGGAWVLALRRLERAGGEGSATWTYRARWAADFVTSEGVRVDGPDQDALVDEGCDHDELTPLGSSDFDGDGRGELALGGTHFWCGDGDGDNPRPVTVLTARGGTIGAYAPFARVGAVQRATDFDGDGRLDFIDEARWGRVECDPAAVGVDDSPGPLSLWHSLPDGTFTRTDAVAHAFLRRGACAAPPTRLYDPMPLAADERLDGSGALFRAVCAQAHGWSIERVQLQALAELRAAGPFGPAFACNDLEWLSWRILTGPPATP